MIAIYQCMHPITLFESLKELLADVASQNVFHDYFHPIEFRKMIMMFTSVGNQKASKYHSPSQKGKLITHADL